MQFTGLAHGLTVPNSPNSSIVRYTCNKSKNPGKITKIRALSRQFSPNARISGQARIYPGDLVALVSLWMNIFRKSHLYLVCSQQLCKSWNNYMWLRERNTRYDGSRPGPLKLHPRHPWVGAHSCMRGHIWLVPYALLSRIRQTSQLWAFCCCKILKCAPWKC